MTSFYKNFVNWFFDEPYPQLGKNRATVFLVTNKGERDYWMSQAYMAGAQAMAKETLNILGDWAAATEGLDPEMLEPSEVYDRARENLHHYIHNQLELFK